MLSSTQPGVASQQPPHSSDLDLDLDLGPHSTRVQSLSFSSNNNPSMSSLSFPQAGPGSSTLMSHSGASAHTAQVIATISMSEILDSQVAYKEMLKAAAEYRKAMRTMSKHARTFADALSKFAESVESSADDESIFAIRKYSEMQLMFAAGNDTTCDLFDSQFESPLKSNYQNHKLNVKHNADKYKRAKEQHSKQMKVLEREEARATKNVRSDLNHFQDTLRELSRMATSLEILKNDHFDAVVEEERRNSAVVAERCGDWIGLELNVLWGKVAGTAEHALQVLEGQTPMPLIQRSVRPANALNDDDMHLVDGMSEAGTLDMRPTSFMSSASAPATNNRRVSNMSSTVSPGPPRPASLGRPLSSLTKLNNASSVARALARSQTAPGELAVPQPMNISYSRSPTVPMIHSPLRPLSPTQNQQHIRFEDSAVVTKEALGQTAEQASHEE